LECELAEAEWAVHKEIWQPVGRELLVRKLTRAARNRAMQKRPCEQKINFPPACAPAQNTKIRKL